MTNKELLELAAKAAGIDISDATFDGWGDVIQSEWNPLTDDGDALRLSVKLGIHIGYDFSDCIGVTQAAQTLQLIIDEPWGSDGFAATRLAIVKAAAAIG
jgi:hypothetical protein